MDFYEAINNAVQPSEQGHGPKRLPSLKSSYRDTLIKDLRDVIRDNTYTPATQDFQGIAVAFSTKKLLEYLDSTNDGGEMQERMRCHIFDDTWSLLMEYACYSAEFAEGALRDARGWYDGITGEYDNNRMDLFVRVYYTELRKRKDFSPVTIMTYYAGN